MALAEYQDYWDAYRQIGQFLEDVYMKLSQNSLLKAETSVRRVAESGILALVQGITYARDFTPHCSFCVGSRGVTLLAIQQRLGFHSEHTIYVMRVVVLMLAISEVF